MPSQNNLPQQLSSFIGRQPEIAEVLRLLADARLVTLTGSGGSGKTRLAIQVASRLLDVYPDGVWFVDLAPLTLPELVPQTVASTLGLQERPDQTVEATLCDYLRDRQPLILLDNCEHLVAACASLADTLLRACPRLIIVATSRQPLDVSGECTWRIPSLAMPTPNEPHSPQSLEQYEATQLFIERARARRPSYQVTSENSQAIAQLCRLLDGMPLAIELAAARTNVLQVQQILGMISERFRLLISGSESAPRRQQTLSATMDWSYNLLSDLERAVYRDISVFAGGFSLDAVRGVCDGEIDAYEVIEVLSQLIDKSLVTAEHDREGRTETARYGMLETVRQYAWDKLMASGEMPALRERHCAWYLQLAARADAQLLGPDVRTWLDLLDQEHDNLRSALCWVQESEQPEVQVRLCAALRRFWTVRGYWSEARAQLADALSRSQDLEPTASTTIILIGSGQLALSQGDSISARSFYNESLVVSNRLGNRRDIAYSFNGLGYVAGADADLELQRSMHEQALAIFEEIGDRRAIATTLRALGDVVYHREKAKLSVPFYKRSLEIYREVGDKQGIALCLNDLTEIALRHGDYERARELLDEGVALWRELDDSHGAAMALSSYGQIEMSLGHSAAARSLFLESLELTRKLGQKYDTAATLLDLGHLTRHEGDYVAARALFEECLKISREINKKQSIAGALCNLGYLASSDDDFDKAIGLFRDALQLAHEIENRWLIAWCLIGIAGVIATRPQSGPEQLEWGARLLGSARTWYITAADHVWPVDAEDDKSSETGLRARLTPALYQHAFAQGQALTLDEAVRLASQEALKPVQPVGMPVMRSAHRPAHPDELTEREVAVLRLIAEGLSDGQAAERLYLSKRTVQAHLRSIYSKLGVTNRGAAIRYAFQSKLV